MRPVQSGEPRQEGRASACETSENDFPLFDSVATHGVDFHGIYYARASARNPTRCSSNPRRSLPPGTPTTNCDWAVRSVITLSPGRQTWLSCIFLEPMCAFAPLSHGELDIETTYACVYAGRTAGRDRQHRVPGVDAFAGVIRAKAKGVATACKNNLWQIGCPPRCSSIKTTGGCQDRSKGGRHGSRGCCRMARLKRFTDARWTRTPFACTALR